MIHRTNARYSEIDALRGIAVLMVILFHYTTRYSQIYNPLGYHSVFNFEIGKYGVQLFFIVSGFVIFLTLDKTEHAADFIVSRLSRLYPAYWTAVILTFSIVYIFSLPGREVDLHTAMINLTMLQNWFKVSHVDGVYWTLAVELSFYTIMFFLFITGQIKNIGLISLIWLCTIMLSAYLDKHYHINIHWGIRLIFILDHGHLFIAGITFYKIMHSNRLYNYITLLICLLVEYYLNENTVFLIAIYFGVFTLLINGHIKGLSINPLLFLGSISYSLYLIHQNIGYVIIKSLENSNLEGPFSNIIIPLIVSVYIASVMQVYIEKPSLIIIRNQWKSSKLRRHLVS